MSWLEFLNFSGIVICVSKSLNRSQYLCLWYFHLHRVIFKTVDKLFSSTIFNVFVSVFVYTLMSLSSCWSYDVSSSFWSIVRKDPCVYDSSAVLWRRWNQNVSQFNWLTVILSDKVIESLNFPRQLKTLPPAPVCLLEFDAWCIHMNFFKIFLLICIYLNFFRIFLLRQWFHNIRWNV